VNARSAYVHPWILVDRHVQREYESRSRLRRRSRLAIRQSGTWRTLLQVSTSERRDWSPLLVTAEKRDLARADVDTAAWERAVAGIPTLLSFPRSSARVGALSLTLR
jgi:hypothetical protein